MDDKPTDNDTDDTTPEEESPEEETSFSETSLDKEPSENADTSDTDSATPEVPPKTSFALPIQQPKRSKKPLLWALVVLIIVLIAAGVAFYFLVVAKPAKETPVASTSPSPTPVKEFTAETLVQEVSAHLKGTPVTVAKSDATSGEATTGQVVYSAPYYQVSGKQFKTVPLKSFGTATKGTKDVTTADYTTTTTFLADHEFKQTSSHTGEPGETEIASSTYASDKIVCFVENIDLASTDVKADVVGIGCADVSSYVEAATAAQPFYDAYVASSDIKQHPEYAQDLSIGAPTINNGAGGYKNAWVSLPGFAGIFYQEPGKNWVYFTGAQNELSCDQFNTDVLKKSFAGQPCFDGTTNKDSTVTAV